MKKQKSMGNRGFSLVELIIVIAIMAILVGVMAPQLIRYVEKTNVSNDIQVADSIRMAVQTAILDPSVISDSNSETLIQSLDVAAGVNLSTITGSNEFVKAVWQTILGKDTEDVTSVKNKLKSKGAINGEIMIRRNGNDIIVWITNTDKNGEGKTGAGNNTDTAKFIRVPADAPSPSPAPTTP